MDGKAVKVDKRNNNHLGWMFADDSVEINSIPGISAFIDKKNNIIPASSVLTGNVGLTPVAIGPTIELTPNTSVLFHRTNIKDWSIDNIKYTQFAICGEVEAFGNLQSLKNYDREAEANNY